MPEINKQDLFNVIKYGHVWHLKRIKEFFSNEMQSSLVSEHHSHFGYDREDNYYYLHDNDCYLFISDGLIEVRSDRVNVLSEDKIYKFEINDAQDILRAYEKFVSVINETNRL